MKKFIFSIFSVIIMIGCGAGVSDIVEDLPNNYTYMSESLQQKLIMKNPLSIDSDAYIPCQVIDYKYNEQYIIAKIKFHYDMNCVVGFKERNILKEGKIYYYIIDTKKDIRYGAYKDLDELTKKKELLNIELIF